MRTWQENAAEFKALDAGEGWPFAVLVACSVERGTGAHRVARATGAKVSAREFAELAGTSADRVLRYLDGWTEAAAYGVVPGADVLKPSDAHQLVIPDAAWSTFYRPVSGGRQRSVASVIETIERKGAADIVDAMPETTRRELADAIVRRERFDDDAAAVMRGGRVPSLDELNEPATTGHRFAPDSFEETSRLMGRVFRELREHPPTTDAQRERVRDWSLGLLNVVDPVMQR